MKYTLLHINEPALKDRIPKPTRVCQLRKCQFCIYIYSTYNVGYRHINVYIYIYSLTFGNYAIVYLILVYLFSFNTPLFQYV